MAYGPTVTGSGGDSTPERPYGLAAILANPETAERLVAPEHIAWRDDPEAFQQALDRELDLMWFEMLVDHQERQAAHRRELTTINVPAVTFAGRTWSAAGNVTVHFAWPREPRWFDR